LITLTVTGISIVSLIFPALVTNLLFEQESTVNPFEIGFWAIPFFIINFAFLYLGILYYKNRLPEIIRNFFALILNFEISQKKSFIIITILLCIYVVFSVGELGNDERDSFGDHIYIQEMLKNYPFNSQKEIGLTSFSVKNFLIFVSQTVFQNVRIVPFLASIALLVMTYFLSAEITNKRFAGIISMILY